MEKIQIGKQKRIIRKNFYEKAAWQGKSFVCGIDEVGRGCLAGPLVSSAVILPIGCRYSNLADSKLMSKGQRDLAYKWITKNCFYGIGVVSSSEIDKYNIWQATLIAMKRATMNLLAIFPSKPSAFLIDAMPLKLLDTSYKNIPVFHFNKGESKSTSIAAASIVAKVTRDRLMQMFDSIFPNYGLAKHKGYGTKKHKDSVIKNGHSIIHRVSFLGKTVLQERNEEQQSLF